MPRPKTPPRDPQPNRCLLGWGLPLILLLAGCPHQPIVPSTTDGPVPADVLRTLSPVPPLPPDPTNRFADDERAARLGHRLFFDKGLSRDGGHSCASCHQPDKAFADGLPIAVGLERGTRNTPSLLNVAHQRWQGWAGKADSVWLQSLNALEDPKEQGAKRLAVVHRLQTTYKEAYDTVFGPLPSPDGLPTDGHPGEPAFETLTTAQKEQIDRAVVNVGKALGAYIRKLSTGPAPFDRYVAGNRAALSPAAERGLVLFTGRLGCISCHSGPLLSDGAFHNVGIPHERSVPEDLGRAHDLPELLANPRNGESRWSDDPKAWPLAPYKPQALHAGQFKTPILRNVALTAPYWHNGTGTFLDSTLTFEAVGGGAAAGVIFPGVIDPLLKPHQLSYRETQDVVAFLQSLTGTPVPDPWGKAPTP